MSMSEEELYAAVLAELTEYGEIMIFDEDVAYLTDAFARNLVRALSVALDESLFMTYDMQQCGYKIKRTGQPRHQSTSDHDYREGFRTSSWDTFSSGPRDQTHNDWTAGMDGWDFGDFKFDEWQRLWLMNFSKRYGA